MGTFHESARNIPVIDRCQVLVAGAGPGGLFAALAAARLGASVTLVDRMSYLGGNLASGLPIIGFQDMTGELLVKGLPEEFIQRLINMGASTGHLHCPKHVSITPVDPEAAKLVADELCAQAGVKVLLETFLSMPIVQEGRMSGAIVESKSGRGAILADIVIDATGDADLAAQAGVPFEQGSPGQGHLQPPSLMFRLTGVDTNEFRSYLEANPDEVYPIGKPDAHPFPMAYFREVPRFVVVGLEGLANSARRNQDFPEDLRFVIVNLLPSPGEVAINAAKVFRWYPENNQIRSEALAEGRRKAWRLANFFKKYVPGFEKSFMTSTAETMGVRESRRVLGEYQLTLADVRGGARFDDAVCKGAYPIDIHMMDGSRSTFILLDGSYDIPYRCLVPRGCRGLLVAGRSISVSREAFGSTRVMGPCMGVGQGAGVAAALCVQNGIQPRAVDISMLRKKLQDLGAII